ncbi:CPLX3 protein, partial [Polyodon spathula]|nr:CPLX3 protein [Polyodon spathula]
MASMVKSVLGAPIKLFSPCLSLEEKEQEQRSAPCRQKRRTADELHRYQEQLEEEKRKRDARYEKRNGERAAMRTHFRHKYQLTQNAKDDNHLNAVGGKVVLPRELAAVVRSEVPTAQERGFSLFGSFQGLDLRALRESAQNSSQQCRVV